MYHYANHRYSGSIWLIVINIIKTVTILETQNYIYTEVCISLCCCCKTLSYWYVIVVYVIYNISKGQSVRSIFHIDIAVSITMTVNCHRRLLFCGLLHGAAQCTMHNPRCYGKHKRTSGKIFPFEEKNVLLVLFGW